MKGTALLGVLLIGSSLGSGSLALASPTSDGEQNIIGGTGASVGQFPQTVVMTIGQGLCTGTLIDPEWILTAAHCVTPSVVQLPDQATVTARTRVHFDTVNLNRDAGRSIAASMTIPKPGFSINALGSNDIGLVKLATPVTDIEPVRVNFDPTKAPVGLVVTQVGYGATQGGNPPGGSFGVANVLVDRTSTSCAPYRQSNENVLCFNQTDSKGKCQGDSGGPSFAMIDGQLTQVGVTSFGDQTCGQLGVDTRTDAERDWLLMYVPSLEAQCEETDDCEDGQECFNSQCIAEPFTTGGLGATCEDGPDCDSGLCAGGPGGPLCTMLCTPGSNAGCPDDFECRNASDDQGACWPEDAPDNDDDDDDGGCCSSSNGSPAGALLLGLGLVLAVGRRRRR
jgi:MYXO-CTERM domain-containing protein